MIHITLQVIVIIVSFVYTYPVLNNYSFWRMVHAFHFCCGLFPVTGVVLFAILSLWACYGFRAIHDEIQNVNLENDFCQRYDIDTNIKRWKCNYLLLFNYVNELNSMFGPILLLASCHVFVVTVTGLFFGFSELSLTSKLSFETELEDLIVYPSKNLIDLFVVCFIADRIQQEVGSTFQVRRVLHITV